MRALAVAIGLLAFATTADAKPKKAAKSVAAKSVAAKSDKRAKKHEAIGKKKGKRTAIRAHQREQFFEPRGPVHGQSVGAPWAGRLRDATELPQGEGYVLRRPWRA